jgi:hypothetical protein
MVNRNQPKGAVMQQTATRPESDSAPPQTSPDPRAEKLTITPELASQMLVHNTHNRPLVNRRVELLAGAMARGEWQPENGQMITVSREGILIDGQHRLAAVVESGATIENWVFWNAPLSAQETVDIGAKRSVADMLRLRGKVYPTRLPAVVRMIKNYYDVNSLATGANVGYTPQEIIAFIDEHDDELLEHIRIGGRTAAGVASGLATMFGALSYLFSEVDDEASEYFLLSLQHGSELNRFDPIYVLREQIIGDRLRATRRADRATYAAWSIKAFGAHRENREVRALAWRRGGVMREPFPLILGHPANKER